MNRVQPFVPLEGWDNRKMKAAPDRQTHASIRGLRRAAACANPPSSNVRMLVNGVALNHATKLSLP